MALWPHSIVRGIGWQHIAAYVTLSVSYVSYLYRPLALRFQALILMDVSYTPFPWRCFWNSDFRILASADCGSVWVLVWLW